MTTTTTATMGMRTIRRRPFPFIISVHILTIHHIIMRIRRSQCRPCTNPTNGQLVPPITFIINLSHIHMGLLDGIHNTQLSIRLVPGVERRLKEHAANVPVWFPSKPGIQSQ
mmetsp:Transcript_27875/g.53038  ORF Transcript_27875/g.53038 Transcript_27875/m.53038 type:complete len:112 (-) Transcript_27875:309-644(-)